jgi:CheY-like chemotaxis protein
VAPEAPDSFFGNPELILELALKMLDFSMSRVLDGTGRIALRASVRQWRTPPTPVSPPASPGWNFRLWRNSSNHSTTRTNQNRPDNSMVTLWLTASDTGPPILAEQLALGIQPLMPRPCCDGKDLLSCDGDFELATACIVAGWLGGTLKFGSGRPDCILTPALEGIIRLRQVADPSPTVPSDPYSSLRSSPASPPASPAACQTSALSGLAIPTEDPIILPFEPGWPKSATSLGPPPEGEEASPSSTEVWPLRPPTASALLPVLANFRLALVCDYPDTARALRDSVVSAGAHITTETMLPCPSPGSLETPHRIAQMQTNLRIAARAYDTANVLLVCVTPELVLDTLAVLVEPRATVGPRIGRQPIVALVAPAWVSLLQSDLDRLHGTCHGVLLLPNTIPSRSLARAIQQAWCRVQADPVSVLAAAAPALGRKTTPASPVYTTHDEAAHAALWPPVPHGDSPPVTALVGEHSQPAPLLRLPAGTRVLVVEDNRLNAMVLRRLLTKLGLESDLATDGLEALRILQDSAAAEETPVTVPSSDPLRRYAIVLMDLHMPRMDGLQATRQLRLFERQHHRPRIPVVAVSASVAAESQAECWAAGMDGFVSKPITAEVLSRILAAQLQYL